MTEPILYEVGSQFCVIAVLRNCVSLTFDRDREWILKPGKRKYELAHSDRERGVKRGLLFQTVIATFKMLRQDA